MDLLTILYHRIATLRVQERTPSYWMFGASLLHHLITSYPTLFVFSERAEPTILGYPFQIDPENTERLELVAVSDSDVPESGTPDADRLIKRALGED